MALLHPRVHATVTAAIMTKSINTITATIVITTIASVVGSTCIRSKIKVLLTQQLHFTVHTATFMQHEPPHLS